MGCQTPPDADGVIVLVIDRSRNAVILPAMSIGDLANDVARALYEQRIVVAILSVVALVGLTWLAHRLGWLAAARRHPARSGVVAAVALAVALPVGWYLGSPIFIRTSLVEALPSAAPVASSNPAPSVAASPAPTAPPSSTPSAVPSPAATASPSPSPFVARTVASGEFQGTDDFHFGRGTASIIETSPGRFHLRLEDFSVRNGPDLYVYLSPSADGWTEDALELGTLKATDGSFGYDLPEGADPAAYRSAIIWCKQFSHLFATAAFTS
jgi:hypothetical protein